MLICEIVRGGLKHNAVQVEIAYLLGRRLVNIVRPWKAGRPSGIAMLPASGRQIGIMRGLREVVQIIAMDMPGENTESWRDPVHYAGTPISILVLILASA